MAVDRGVGDTGYTRLGQDGKAACAAQGDGSRTKGKRRALILHVSVEIEIESALKTYDEAEDNDGKDRGSHSCCSSRLLAVQEKMRVSSGIAR